MDPNLEEFAEPELYDSENDWGPSDDFYLALTRDTGGPVLDVGCGTGRLTRAIAKEGLEVTGLDIVPAMVDRARALAVDLPVEWIEADCRDFGLERRFRCIVMTGHAFQNLLTDADQDAFLDRARRHLVPGGTLAFETRSLRAKSYGDGDDPVLWKSFRDPRGRSIDVWVTSRFDPGTMLDHVRIERRVRGSEESRSSRIALRYESVERLDRRLDAHGFRVTARYGDWNRAPYDVTSPEIISVCRAGKP